MNNPNSRNYCFWQQWYLQGLYYETSATKNRCWVHMLACMQFSRNFGGDKFLPSNNNQLVSTNNLRIIVNIDSISIVLDIRHPNNLFLHFDVINSLFSFSISSIFTEEPSFELGDSNFWNFGLFLWRRAYDIQYQNSSMRASCNIVSLIELFAKVILSNTFSTNTTSFSTLRSEYIVRYWYKKVQTAKYPKLRSHFLQYLQASKFY